MFFQRQGEEPTCVLCGKRSLEVSAELRLCGDCIRTKSDNAEAYAVEAHRRSRRRFGLPEHPPRSDRDGSAPCGQCVNGCLIPPGESGFCGIRGNVAGRVRPLTRDDELAVVESYYDPLPTNCVAGWFCPGCTGLGYPRYSVARNGPEPGCRNLAVFYGACTFDCLFCQNWHYREATVLLQPTLSAEQLAGRVDDSTTCICYFGGDPTPQMKHAIRTSNLAIGNAGDRILRICWETNGSMSWGLLKEAAELSITSGGCVKFDLKAFDDNLHKALTGISNRNTLGNFEYLAGRICERPEVPLLTASTLLVPGYIDAEEVSRIAGFVAELDRRIPYSLLAFHPDFRMSDLPVTSRKLAEDCFRAAKLAGLDRVNIGNVHLMGVSPLGS